MDSVTSGFVFQKHLDIDNVKLLTVVCLPRNEGEVATVIIRSPYVDSVEYLSEEKIFQNKPNEYKVWFDNGYFSTLQR